MDASLILVQVLNGVQLGVMLFLIAAGLTLVFGVMDLINLAHGSLYMIGAYLTATFAAWSGSFGARPAARGAGDRAARRGGSRRPRCARCMTAATSTRCSRPSA